MLNEIYKIEQLDDGTYLINSLKGQFKKSLTELSIEELRKTIGQLGSIANKRITRIQTAGIYSPAVKALQESMDTDTPSFSTTKGVDYSNGSVAINQLRARLAQIKKFLDSETSTVTGARQYKSDVESRLGLENASEKALSVIWRVISTVKEINPIIANYQSLGNFIYERITDDIPDISELDTMTEQEIDDLINRIAESSAEKSLEDYYKEIDKASSFNF